MDPAVFLTSVKAPMFGVYDAVLILGFFYGAFHFVQDIKNSYQQNVNEVREPEERSKKSVVEIESDEEECLQLHGHNHQKDNLFEDEDLPDVEDLPDEEHPDDDEENEFMETLISLQNICMTQALTINRLSEHLCLLREGKPILDEDYSSIDGYEGCNTLPDDDANIVRTYSPEELDNVDLNSSGIPYQKGGGYATLGDVDYKSCGAHSIQNNKILDWEKQLRESGISLSTDIPTM